MNDDTLREIVDNINVGNLQDGDIALSDVVGEEIINETVEAIQSWHEKKCLEVRINEVHCVYRLLKDGKSPWDISVLRRNELQQQLKSKEVGV